MKPKIKSNNCWGSIKTTSSWWPLGNSKWSQTIIQTDGQKQIRWKRLTPVVGQLYQLILSNTRNTKYQYYDGNRCFPINNEYFYNKQVYIYSISKKSCTIYNAMMNYKGGETRIIQLLLLSASLSVVYAFYFYTFILYLWEFLETFLFHHRIIRRCLVPLTTQRSRKGTFSLCVYKKQIKIKNYE